MLVSEKIAIAAHLHVLLRRKTGRVTDTEWMAQNTEYATEIIRFARARAAEDGHPDLAEWAGKLESALQGMAVPRVPLAQAALGALRQRAENASPSEFADSLLEGARKEASKEPTPLPPRYVGGIR